MKVGTFAKREQGESAEPSEWDSCNLSAPTVVSVFAMIGDQEEFPERCHEECRRLGVGGVSSAVADGAKWELLESSFEKIEKRIERLLGEKRTKRERESLLKLRKGLKKGRWRAVESLLRYLAGNREQLNYCERLRSGRVIGSGLIEEACKNLVGRRLKQTGVRWRVERANKIALLPALICSNQWKNDWIYSN